jgi:hypothetical protein
MFNDKKLRNTFWLAVLGVIAPVLLLMMGLGINIGVYSFDAPALLIIIALVINIYVLIQLMRNWKKWPQPAIKITALILALLGTIFSIGAEYLMLSLSYMVHTYKN